MQYLLDKTNGLYHLRFMPPTGTQVFDVPPPSQHITAALSIDSRMADWGKDANFPDRLYCAAQLACHAIARPTVGQIQRFAVSHVAHWPSRHTFGQAWITEVFQGLDKELLD